MIEFPLLDVDLEGACVCGADGCRGKHPAIKGFLDLQESVPHGERYGIVTGHGFFVLDVDRKNGKDGEAWLEEMDLPPTRTIGTASGGYHLYYLAPDFPVPSDNTGWVAEGVDVKGTRGFVVGPGTPGYSVLIDRPMAEPPAWLVARLRDLAAKRLVRSDKTRGEAKVKPVDPGTPEFIRRLQIANDYLAKAPPCVSGKGGHAQLWSVALYLCRTLELPEDVALLALQPYNDRCDPPWSEKDLMYKLDQAVRKGQTPCGIAPEGWTIGMGEAILKTKSGAVYDPAVDRPLTEKKRPIEFDTLVNLLLTHPDWEGVLGYDEFTDRPTVINPPYVRRELSEHLADSDYPNIRLWLLNSGFKAPTLDVVSAVETACRHNRYHVVRQYLASLPATDGSYLEGLAPELFGSTNPADNELFKRFLVAAVRRVLTPGYKCDTILVLEGEQGLNKSSFCARLFGEWFKDQLASFDNKDSSDGLRGAWGIEMPEMTNLNKSSIESIKAFLSRQEDCYRPSYGRNEIRRKRQCVFIATTNKVDYLRDETGHRRYWPIDVRKPCSLTFDRDKLWGAAYALAMSGYPSYVRKEDVDLSLALADKWGEHSDEAHPWERKIEKYLAACVGKKNLTISYHEAYDVIEPVASKQNDAGKVIITRCLRSLGCKPVKVGKVGKRMWQIPNVI